MVMDKFNLILTDDPCNDNNGGCEQGCFNLDGQVRCYCRWGQLGEDGKSCHGKFF